MVCSYIVPDSRVWALLMKSVLVLLSHRAEGAGNHLWVISSNVQVGLVVDSGAVNTIPKQFEHLN